MRFSYLLPILLVGLACSTADAQFQQRQQEDRPSVGIYFDGGVTNPIGPDVFNDSWTIGYNLGTGVAVRVNNRMMVRPRLTYNSFALDGDAVPDTIAVDPSVLEDGRYSTLAVSGELLVELAYNPFPIKPFFIIGGGYFRGQTSNLQDLREEVDLGVRGSRQGRASLRGGIGVHTPLTDFLSLFGELKVVVGFTGGFGVMYAPISLGTMVRF